MIRTPLPAGVPRRGLGLGLAVVIVVGAALVTPWEAGAQEPDQDAVVDSLLLDAPLELEDVLRSVEATYPPFLAALVERDIADGHLRAARGVFDLDLEAATKGTLDGFYEYTTVEAGLEQFLGLWGSTLYGGYRLTTGDTLPDYYPERTQGDGEAMAGLRIPLLRGGAIDAARTDIRTAEIEVRSVNAGVARQRLDFLRTGAVAYWEWVAAGQQLRIAREILELANDRADGLEEQVATGFRAEIDLVDNERLIVSREIAVLEAEQAFQAASLTLSLFLRTSEGRPVVPGEELLPPDFPPPALPDTLDMEAAVVRALTRRPELARVALEVERSTAELELARNGLLPVLDANLELADNFGEQLYKDRTETELRGGIKLSVPLQRRKERGKVVQAEGKLDQARFKLAFAREKVAADVREAVVALRTNLEATERAALNAELAAQLQAAEAVRFQEGSSDLLELQIREQTTFDARSTLAKAYLAFYKALADYQAAVARGIEAPEAPPE
jgi:outer membrane protein TolC